MSGCVTIVPSIFNELGNELWSCVSDLLLIKINQIRIFNFQLSDMNQLIKCHVFIYSDRAVVIRCARL